jgi:hypothetical protein
MIYPVTPHRPVEEAAVVAQKIRVPESHSNKKALHCALVILDFGAGTLDDHHVNVCSAASPVLHPQELAGLLETFHSPQSGATFPWSAVLPALSGFIADLLTGGPIVPHAVPEAPPAHPPHAADLPSHAAPEAVHPADHPPHATPSAKPPGERTLPKPVSHPGHGKHHP